MRVRRNYANLQVGETFGKLTTVKAAGFRVRGKRGQRELVWTFRCECGVEKDFVVSKVVNGHVKSCGCIMPSSTRPPGKARRNTPQQDYNYLIKRVWKNHYKDGCSLEEFIRLSQMPCHYCGAIQTNTWEFRGQVFKYNGLDRLDSGLDHVFSNVVPCCWTCNRMKGTLTQEEFLCHIKTIISYCVFPTPEDVESNAS